MSPEGVLVQGRSASLRRLHQSRLRPRIYFENKLACRCSTTSASWLEDASPVMAFIHDDVWIDDHFFFEHVMAGVTAYDVIGVAGNRRRLPGQPSWAFANLKFGVGRPQPALRRRGPRTERLSARSAPLA